ncbi:MAG: amino acid ABC transporter permease [Eggerthellaceae bacterium]|nr:amino acid ABC transporter permease [Eggerthellaceae bacterium]
METERWTAKSNQDSGNEVMGGTPTRVTWQGQSSEDESISSLTLDLPEGSVVDAANVKVTVLSGTERLDTEWTVNVNGSQAEVIFGEPTEPGQMVMLEFNECVLPPAGGTFPVAGTYTLADGATLDIPDSGKSITVVGTTAAESLSVWLNDQPAVQAWNSVKFLHLFFDPAIAVTSVPAVFSGWLLALAMVIISFPLAIPLGLMWSFMRMAKNRILCGIASCYINIIRGTPLFLQIYIAYFGLPQMGVNISGFAMGIIVLVLNSSAYLAEIFRAGIQSIPKGQFEASRSLGMNGAQTMLHVIIPQTVRRVIPTMTSEFILMYKDTSLLAAVGVYEIISNARIITAATGNMTPYIVGAIFYLIVTIPATRAINHMEKRLAEGSRKRKKARAQAEAAGVIEPAPVAMRAVATDGDADMTTSMRLSESFAISPEGALYAQEKKAERHKARRDDKDGKGDARE